MSISVPTSQSGSSCYSPLVEVSMVAFCCSHDAISTVLGIKGRTSEDAAVLLDVREVGDGNLNFVYIIRVNNSQQACVVKQALPYVRCVGESWKLTPERAFFEYNCLKEHARLCPGNVPEVYHFDKDQALIVMEYIAPPHQIMRKHLIAGTKLPNVARHLAQFCARTLFWSSALALSGQALREKISEWSRNAEMCALTEDVVFTAPFTHTAPLNRHTTPQLDGYAASIRADDYLQVSVALLKGKFLGCPQALLHGDLHTGSVMAHEDSTMVIDPEFAFYGPMGFDTGALVANFLLAYFSHRGHGGSSSERQEYKEWILEQISVFYRHFETLFDNLWSKCTVGGAYDQRLFPARSAAESLAQRTYMRALFRDTVGFAGVKMIRRILGVAHVADLEEIDDADVRANCEKRVLIMARVMVIQGSGLTSDDATVCLTSWCGGVALGRVEDLIQFARKVEAIPDSELGDNVCRQF